MSTAVEGLDVPTLEAYLSGALRAPLQVELLHGGRSNLTYRLTDGHGTWVLRRPPLGGLTPSAHDMAREYRVVSALAGSGVPVAPAVVLCEDPAVLGVPFAVVGFVDGVVLRGQDDLVDVSDADLERCAFGLVDVLARLHAVDPAAVGLGEFGRAEGYLSRQVRRWHDQWTRVSTRELTDLDRLHARLAASCPAERGASIVHGDFRIDNAILDPADPAVVRALVDWEMATLGDPLADLGLHLVYSDPAFDPVLGGAAAATSPRLPSPERLVERYAAASGRDVGDMAFHLGLGYLKAAVIAEGIHARHMEGNTRGPGFEATGDAVPLLVEAGLRALDRRGNG